MQRNHAAHHASQRLRNLRILRIGKVLHARHAVPMHLRMKCLRHLFRRPRKNHQPVSRGNLIHGKAVSPQPLLHPRPIDRTRAKPRPKLRRGQPLVKVF